MPEKQSTGKPDPNEEAVRQVNELTDSDPVNGEGLLESEDLKRLLREAKQREAQRRNADTPKH